MRLSVFTCCFHQAWHKLREDKEKVKALLKELKKGNVTMFRVLAFYPPSLPDVKKKLWLVPWELRKTPKGWLYDLDRKNTDYWASWLEFIQLMHIAGFIPVLSLFDYCHRFDPKDRGKSPFTRNIQGVDMLNPRDSEGHNYLLEFVKQQITLVRNVLGIKQFYVELGNEFFKEKGCCPKGSDECKPTYDNWCSHEAIKKLGKYLVSALGVKRSQILVPTSYKEGDYFHNTGIFGFEGAHAKYRDFHPDFHLGILKRKPPSWEGWSEREWHSFLNDFLVYFSTDGLGRADLPAAKERDIHVRALNWALRQTNKVFAVEIMPGFLWGEEYAKGEWGNIPQGYFKWIKDHLTREVTPHEKCLCDAFNFIDNNYTIPQPQPGPGPQPAKKSWWEKVWEWIRKILKKIGL